MGEFLVKYWSQCLVIIGLLGFIGQQAWIWHYKKKERYYDRYSPLIDAYLDSVFNCIDKLKQFELYPFPTADEMDQNITYPAFKLIRNGEKLSFYSDDKVRDAIGSVCDITSEFLFQVNQIYQNRNSLPNKLNEFGLLKKNYIERMYEQLSILSKPIKKYLRQ